jgi:apolipoprotein N-acyltransferase
MATTPERPVHVALPRTGIRSVPIHLILTAATTLMLLFTFAPRGHGWLAYIALVPAGLLAARASTARRLAWTSFTVFWAGWLVMIAWVIPISPFAHIALAALMAAYWSLALVIAHQLHKHYRSAMVVLLPLAWVSCEWVRGRFLAGGFSWFMLGQSQASFVPDTPAGRIVQTADLFGELGVSLIVVMTSGLVIDLMTRPIMQPIGHGKHRLHPMIRGAGILWLLVIIGAYFYGEYRVGQWHDVTRPGPRVAVIQTNVSQNNKINRSPEQDLEDWGHMVDLTRQAGATTPTPDLIVWPETMVPTAVNPEAIRYFKEVDSYYKGSEVYHESIRMLAMELGVNMLIGSSAYEGFIEETFPDGAVGPVPMPRYNSSYHYYADGEQAPLRYDKIHRVPFGEYIPWVGAVPPIKSLFIKVFTPYARDYSLAQGEALTVFDIPVMPVADVDTNSVTEPNAPMVVRVVTPICYEDAVARAVRRLVYAPDGAKRADLVVNITNSAWYPGHYQQPQHLQIATLRCIENRVPMARSVNGGISGFINSLGQVQAVVEVGGQSQWVPGYAVDTPRLDDRRTLYGLLGELPVGILALITAMLLIWGKISPRKTVK